MAIVSNCKTRSKIFFNTICNIILCHSYCDCHFDWHPNGRVSQAPPQISIDDALWRFYVLSLCKVSFVWTLSSSKSRQNVMTEKSTRVWGRLAISNHERSLDGAKIYFCACFRVLLTGITLAGTKRDSKTTCSCRQENYKEERKIDYGFFWCLPNLCFLALSPFASFFNCYWILIIHCWAPQQSYPKACVQMNFCHQAPALKIDCMINSDKYWSNYH